MAAREFFYHTDMIAKDVEKENEEARKAAQKANRR
jgi:hypothetical protein